MIKKTITMTLTFRDIYTQDAVDRTAKDIADRFRGLVDDEFAVDGTELSGYAGPFVDAHSTDVAGVTE